MIKVTVFYPKTETSTFDIDYYCNRHMPMLKEKCGPALEAMNVDYGLAGGAPGTQPPYSAMGHLYFETVDAFQSAFGPHAKAILADVPNYTNVKPIVQVSEVKI